MGLNVGITIGDWNNITVGFLIDVVKAKVNSEDPTKIATQNDFDNF